LVKEYIKKIENECINAIRDKRMNELERKNEAYMKVIYKVVEKAKYNSGGGSTANYRIEVPLIFETSAVK
jgi:hypothetical protein